MNNQKSINQTALNQSALIEAMPREEKRIRIQLWGDCKAFRTSAGNCAEGPGGCIYEKSPPGRRLLRWQGFLLPEQDLFLEQAHNSGTISDPVKSLGKPAA